MNSITIEVNKKYLLHFIYIMQKLNLEYYITKYIHDKTKMEQKNIDIENDFENNLDNIEAVVFKIEVSKDFNILEIFKILKTLNLLTNNNNIK
jgi:hypothetical protein